MIKKKTIRLMITFLLTFLFLISIGTHASAQELSLSKNSLYIGKNYSVEVDSLLKEKYIEKAKELNAIFKKPLHEVVKEIKSKDLYEEVGAAVEPVIEEQSMTEEQPVETVSIELMNQVIPPPEAQFTTTTDAQTDNTSLDMYSCSPGYEMNIDQFEISGIVYWGEFKYSYYSERILPGTALDIPGRNTTDGFVRDGNGYLVLASNTYPKGSVLPTPFGACGIVRDYCPGCASNQLDVYTR